MKLQEKFTELKNYNCSYCMANIDSNSYIRILDEYKISCTNCQSSYYYSIVDSGFELNSCKYYVHDQWVHVFYNNKPGVYLGREKFQITIKFPISKEEMQLKINLRKIFK